VPSAVAPLPLVVVGIGADGWSGLTAAARDALLDAEVVLGGARHCDLLAGRLPARLVTHPSPLLPGLDALLERESGQRLALLASGDPMFFGIGNSLIRRYGPTNVQVHSHPSSVSLAAARMGWAVEDTDVVSVVGRPIATVVPYVQPGRRVLVLVRAPDGAAHLQELVADLGYGRSTIAVLEQLGGPGERIANDTGPHDALAIVAIEIVADDTTRPLPRTPGLPDDAFAHDGQITKREIRALVLAALAPVPGQLLWDVGAGSGSVGIEWMRVHPASRAIAIEPRADRRAGIQTNANALGVPGLRIVAGAAPAALADLPRPDAVFVGGGVSIPGVIEAGLDALGVGGRLVANAVTVETETVLAGWHALLGGTLTRIAIQRAEPIGGFTGWRPAMPVTQWAYRKEPV
jgi:precorrin-6Y C5,15-methyltransferase (decarboxylating)